MDPPSSIFRAEALEALRSGAGAGDILRISPRWASATYWLVLAVVIGAFGYCAFARINEYASGAAVVVARGDARSVVAFFPARFRSQLRTGMFLRFHSEGEPAPRELRIDEVADGLLSTEEAEHVLGGLPLGKPGDTFAQVHARADDLPVGGVGQVEVRLRSRSILATLVPALARQSGAR